MVNVNGVNGWGEKNYPPDDALRQYLLKLATQSLSVPDKLIRLRLKFDIDIGRSHFFKLQKRLGVPSIRRPGLSPTELEAAVMTEVEDDLNQMKGPLAIKEVLQLKRILVPRDKIVALMKQYAPEGFDYRFPGSSQRRIIRQHLSSVGPFREICADGHEKLNSQALQMGGLSIPIYAYRDKWSGVVLDLQVVPDSRHSGTIGHIYLDLIHKWNGIPTQLTTDKGSEIGWETTMQSVFREFYAPDVDMDQFPPSVTLPSTRNTVIEGLWRWLREKSGLNIKDIILAGKHRFYSHVQEHHYLFYWIFVPLIQQDLDKFMAYWNNHKVRNQKSKLMPSGHIPMDALRHPALFGGHQCLIQVPEDAQIEMRNILSEAVGSREMHLSWYSLEFGLKATEVYKGLGSPPLSLSSAWDVFTNMAMAMGSQYHVLE